jgi:hypothetical protein
MRNTSFCLIGSVVFGLFFGLGPALAEDPTHEEMLCALNPDCHVPFVDRRLRGVTSTPAVRPAHSFDVTLNFAFDSAELTSEASANLDKVAKVLTDPGAEKYDIILSGHTDAVGSAEYNQQLSERRAHAARNYLINRHGIESSRLIAKGYGKSQLLLPSDSKNGLNRRVQFQNASAALASSPLSNAPDEHTLSFSDNKAGVSARPAAEGTGL